MAGPLRPSEERPTDEGPRVPFGPWTAMALALVTAGTACSHDGNMSDSGDGDVAAPPDDGEGSSNPDGDAETLPETVMEDGGEAPDDGGREDGPAETDAPDDVTISPDDGAPDGPPPTCGNGLVEDGEECDDGNAIDTDECPSNCRTARCGDGYVRAGVEACDPGGPSSVPGCDSDCTAAECGDGVLGIVEGWADGFESGTLADPPWQNGEPYGFEITSLYVHGGTNALGSTNAGVRRSTAWIRLQAATGGEVCFWYMGEPASSWGSDEFQFQVDGDTVFTQRAAQLAWVPECVSVTPGIHVFEWRYEKGRNGTGTGLDAFYIDDIDTGGPFYEACDDGNTSNTDACVDGCNSAACGDGHIWSGVEDCEGASVGCTTSCGSAGSQTCTDCRYAGGCVPPVERCNGADDDCDTTADEGYDCGSGDWTSCTNACGESGTQTCGSTCTWGACCAGAEVCQCGTLCDDNCDGTTDEGCIPC